MTGPDITSPLPAEYGPDTTTGSSPRARTSLCASGVVTPATCLAVKSTERRSAQATGAQVAYLMTAGL